RDLKAKDESLSLASVYNVTEKLAEVGLINELISPDGQKHYDGIIDFHGHFFCKECGKIMDVSCIKDFIPDELDGVRLDSMSLIMSGVCRECLG
ncbi:MAG: transcriptional repressor, partial [Clostridiales bacterium]|nr:transcriptional repressor [Clostridiales bacterium]